MPIKVSMARVMVRPNPVPPKAAAGKAEADSRQRVTELEQNVHRLDQALNGKGGGEAGAASSGSGSSSASCTGR